MAQADSPGERQASPGFTLSSRYEIREILGEGGTGTVHKAHDILLDRDVAIKILRPHDLASDLPSRRFFREAQALARLNHPNILTLYDHGQIGNLQYLVMELGGRDLSSVLKSKGGPMPINEVIALALGICRAVEYAHDQGVIHRDLKPANVLVSDATQSAGTSNPSGTLGVKVMDFGLAKMREVPALTGSFTTIGTAQYMSPEQAAGREAEERSDLYSFGILLYELCTGILPFNAGYFQSMLAQHLNLAPVPPSTHNPEIPQSLESLILRLMEKDAANRPSTAGEVVATLEALTLGAPQPLHSEDNPPTGVFVGRQQEMGQLTAALEGAISGRGRLVMLAGEPGIGKTRTAQELAAHAQTLGAQVLWGRCYEGEGAPPYWPWVQPIRAYVQQASAEQLTAEMGPGAADIAEIVAEVRDKLRDLKTPPALEPEQARFRLFDSITTFFKNAAQSRPLMLVLDDLHWADQPSLLLLQFLARQLSESRLFVLGCYRDVELSRQHPLAETLAQLSREPVFQREVLRGLGQEETGQFIQASAGIEPTQVLTEALYSHTEGNPFFLTEVIRLLLERGELTGDYIARPQDIRIPEGVREVIGQRLNRLSEQCNHVLTTASIIGREFGFKALHMLSEQVSEDQLLEVLEEALGARVIEESPGPGEYYQFAHALVQETLAEELSAARRVRLHARIGEALEELYGADAEAHAAELAHHFAEAEPVLGSGKLVRYSLLAGERALASYAYENAIVHFERGLVARDITLSGTEAAADEEAAALLSCLGRAQAAMSSLHQLPEAINSLARAFQYYFDAGDVERAVALAEYHIAEPSGISGMAAIISQALTLVPPDSHQAGRLLPNYGFSLFATTGDYQSAQEVFNRALVIARREADGPLQMRTLARAAELAWWHLRPQEVIENGRLAAELSGHIDDPVIEAEARQHLARALAVMGDSEAAQTEEKAVITIAEELRDTRLLTAALTMRAESCFFRGEWAEARALIDQGVSSPRLLSTLAVLEHEVGDFDRGAAIIDQLIETRSRTALSLTGFT